MNAFRPLPLPIITGTMTLEAFRNSLDQDKPLDNFTPYLRSLWYDAKGHWELAHDVVDKLADPYSAWIHAYLHRKEGDVVNADYWYVRAGKSRPSETFAKEWEMIASELLEK